MPTVTVEPTPEDGEFLNVDLDTESEQDLAPLVAALEPVTLLLHSGRVAKGYRASFELPVDPPDADSGICALADVVESLSSDARSIWDTAYVRDLNVGVQAGRGARSDELPLAP